MTIHIFLILMSSWEPLVYIHTEHTEHQMTREDVHRSVGQATLR